MSECVCLLIFVVIVIVFHCATCCSLERFRANGIGFACFISTLSMMIMAFVCGQNDSKNNAFSGLLLLFLSHSTVWSSLFSPKVWSSADHTKSNIKHNIGLSLVAYVRVLFLDLSVQKTWRFCEEEEPTDTFERQTHCKRWSRSYLKQRERMQTCFGSVFEFTETKNKPLDQLADSISEIWKQKWVSPNEI